MNNIKLKLTAISPIHIGSGEVYEPMNFIIEDNYLYHFKDEDFFQALPDIKRKAFLNIINENRSDSFVRINKFVKENSPIVKKIAYQKVKVTDGIQKKYNLVIEKISQIEGKRGDYSKVFNRFEIQRIQQKQLKAKDGYSYRGYILGSSLKGAISTAYQEFIYKKEGKKARERKFLSKGRDINKNIFKDLKVSDSKITKIGTKIGFALNKERFEYNFNEPKNNLKLATQIEVILPTSEFIVDIYYQNLDIKEILESCNSHYLPIFKSILSNKTDGKEEFINEYLNDDFYDKYKDFEPKENQYLIRVGKHSGARAVTINGQRKIRVRKDKRNSEILDQETTTWLFGFNENSLNNLLPFGWVLAEIL